jgi:osmoprotectant transport system permease protein
MNRSDVKASAETNISSSVARRVLKGGLALLLVLYICFPSFQTALLSLLFPNEQQLVHSRLGLLQMTVSHMILTISASLIAGIVGVIVGFAVTHGKGRYYREIIRTVNGFVQTMPPAAVVILAFPVLGFGWPPSLLALSLYSVFPVVANTVIGFQSVSADVLDASAGMGMSSYQRFYLVELPLAFPVINTGLRHSFILNIGTATIAAVIGGGGLGTIIISGLTLQNPALVLSGTIVITGLALIADAAFDVLENISNKREYHGSG